MAENLLDHIEAKIQKKERVQAGEIADAYKITYENHLKEYETNGGKAEDFESVEKSFLDRLRAQRDRQLKENGDLTEKLDKSRLAVVDNTKSKEREMKHRNAVTRAWTDTDPEGKGWLDDYEGMGQLNAFGPGRTTYAGALAAMELCDHKLVEKNMKQAKGLFNGSFGVDNYLSDDDINKKLIGEKYINAKEFKNLDLTHQAQGFVAGYLKFADTYLKNPAENAEYRQDLFKHVEDLARKFVVQPVTENKFTHGYTKARSLGEAVLNTGVLNAKVLGMLAPPPLGTVVQGFQRVETLESEKERSEEQMEAFTALLSPIEWKQRWNERLKRSLDPFQKSCNEILAPPGNTDFKFKDPLITEMMEKKPEDLTFSDEAKLLDATEKARDEVYVYLLAKKGKYADSLTENKKMYAGLKARNKGLQTPAISDEEWKNFDRLVRDQALDLDSAGFAPNSSLEDLTSMWKKMVSVRDSNALIQAKYTELEKRVKDGLEKEPAILQFIGEKNLLEKHDDKTKKYTYELKDGVATVDGGRITMNFKNPEVQKNVEAKLNALNASLRGKKLNSDDDLKLQKAKDIIAQAAKDSAFDFDERPGLGDLKNKYDAKFKPVWEKAGKDLETQLKLPVVVPVGPGPGPDDKRRDGREKPGRDGGDPYPEKWKQSKEIPMPKDYQGFSGGLEVTHDDGLHLRSVTSHKVLQTLEKGEGSNVNSITLAEPNGKALLVNGRTFVKIKYKNRLYFARLDHMAKNAASKNLDSGNKGKGKTPEKPESKIDKDIKFLGSVRGEYREVLAKIWKERESGIVEFLLPYNKVVVRCTLQREGGAWVLSWPANNTPGDRGSLRFGGVEEAMREINDGRFAQHLMWETIRNENVYKPYKYGMGDVEKLKLVPGANSSQSAVELELDWHGGGVFDNGNPQVILTALPYGHIRWTVNREKSGPNGQGTREGEAASFEDFARQMEHAKRWNENYDKTKMTDTVVRPEALYANITNPGTFREYEKAIGHIVSFEVTGNELVQMYLDWGGGSSQDTAKNAMLNVWVDGQGRLNYILNFKGTVTKKGFAQNVEYIAKVVGEAKRFALGH